jgi:hypothetical protein
MLAPTSRDNSTLEPFLNFLVLLYTYNALLVLQLLPHQETQQNTRNQHSPSQSQQGHQMPKHKLIILYFAVCIAAVAAIVTSDCETVLPTICKLNGVGSHCHPCVANAYIDCRDDSNPELKSCQSGRRWHQQGQQHSAAIISSTTVPLSSSTTQNQSAAQLPQLQCATALLSTVALLRNTTLQGVRSATERLQHHTTQWCSAEAAVHCNSTHQHSNPAPLSSSTA